MEEEASDQLRLIDDDEVSDDNYDDASEHSDVDAFDSLSLDEENDLSSSSDSSSESDDESHRNALQRERHVDDHQQQEMQRLALNNDELQEKILVLLKRVRRLIKMIQKSRALTSFVRNEANRQQINVETMDGEENGKINDLIKDFHVRWSSTYLMLVRFITARKIVNEMTHSLPNRNRLTIRNLQKLKALSFTHLDWELLQALANILAPFHLATVCLSGRQYPTLSLSYWIEKNLRTYLSIDAPNMPLENALRRLLLNRLEFYFDMKMKADQKHAKLVSKNSNP